MDLPAASRVVRVCEIELSYMGKNKGNPYLVCENVDSDLGCIIQNMIYSVLYTIYDLH